MISVNLSSKFILTNYLFNFKELKVKEVCSVPSVCISPPRDYTNIETVETFEKEIIIDFHNTEVIIKLYYFILEIDLVFKFIL